MAAPATTWANRIVGHADVPPDQLLGNPKNYRRHPGSQQDALAGTIGQIGFLDPVIVQQGSDTVIDGHLRVELALRSGQPTIPVTYVDLTDEEAALALLTIDPISAMAYHDAEQLDALLREVSTDDAAVMAMLAQLAEDAGVIPPDTFDPNAEWVGIPEFHQDDQSGVFQCHVNFATMDDVAAFEELIGQHIPRDRKSIWYPAAKIESYRDKAYVDAA